MPEVSFIYVYYNSYNFIIQSIEKIIKHLANVPFEIIIVINKMDDINEIELLKIDERIKIYISETNVGFGTANNIGFRNSSGKYICIINPDTYIEKDTIEYLISKIEENSNCGLANCMIKEVDGSIQKTVFIKKYNFTFQVAEFFFLHKVPLIKSIFKNYFVLNQDEYLRTQKPDVISGAFMFFRRTVYEKINGFDENLFMYGEDVDISIRAKKISEIMYFPEKSIIHIGDSALGKIPSQYKLDLMYKSLLYTSQKHWGKTKTMILRSIFVINALICYPLAFVVKKDLHKQLLKNRSIIFLKLAFKSIGKK